MTGLTPEPGRVQVEAAFLLWFQLFTEIDDIFSHSCKTTFKLNFDLLQATKNCLFFNSHKLHLCSIDIFHLPCLLSNRKCLLSFFSFFFLLLSLKGH